MVASSDLTLIRNEIGDQLFYDPNKEYEYDATKVYIVKEGDTTSNPILITDYGNTAWI